MRALTTAKVVAASHIISNVSPVPTVSGSSLSPTI